MAIKIHVCTTILTADLRMSVRVVLCYNFTWLPGSGDRLISSARDDWMGDKNKNPKTSQGVPTKPKKFVDQKLTTPHPPQPPTPRAKKSHAEFPSVLNFQKALNSILYLVIWLYFIHETTWLWYAGTTMNLQIVFNTPKNPYVNQDTQKILLCNSPTQNIPESNNFKPEKIFLSSPPLGPWLQ